MLLLLLANVSPSVKAESSICTKSGAYILIVNLTENDRYGYQPWANVHVSTCLIEVDFLTAVFQFQCLGVNAYDFSSTAAQFTAQQLPVALTYVKGSQEYRSYHADVVANDGVRM